MASIDINTNKLLEWLISRHHVAKDWQNNVLIIREKINNAIQDMPGHDGIIKLLSGQHINYFHCLEIVEILRETEADTKNLFGRYGSQRMKDWQDIINCYQKGNLYIAEVAQILMRNVNFEIPSLKKQITKHDQIELECEKKIKDLTRAETIATNEFSASCKQLGISGKKIRSELIELLKEVPALNQKCAENIKNVKAALELYNSFHSFQCGNAANLLILPLLRYLIESGNTTTYEYTYGEKPVSIEEPILNISETKKEADADHSAVDNSNEIDFGDIGTENLIEEIDWGASYTGDEEFEIVEHADMDINLEESGIIVENSGIDGGIAKGNDAYTILDNPKTRDQITNDLMELEMFLQMRLYEMTNSAASGDGELFSQLDAAPTILQMQTVETITTSLDSVRLALGELTSKKAQHLQNIRHSHRYVDLLTENLKQKLDIANRMQLSKKDVQARIIVNRQSDGLIRPMISKIIHQTKELQKQIEADISKRYDSRKVNIVGGINQM